MEQVKKNKSDERIKKYTNILKKSHNVIFRGAPGTGKSYLAKQIAANIVSNGVINDYTVLSDEQKEQVEFVQFHPSYDYPDFVEGLRPVMNDDGSMGFELQDGIFKKFVEKAKVNCEDSKKTRQTIKKEASVDATFVDFFSQVSADERRFKTVRGNEFEITSVDNKNIRVFIPGNNTAKKLKLSINILKKMFESGEKFNKVGDLTKFFKKNFATQEFSYYLVLYKEIKKYMGTSNKIQTNDIVELKNYVFIIDEINRGEISKIFGELFFSIDPGYRGKAGEVSTQFSNMHDESEEKFYIPENVYIIGTMNDIDRSVDSFDFAMRRRFRFIEIKAKDTQDMLANMENVSETFKTEIKYRMDKVNNAILDIPDLNENYQIGAAYFLKLGEIGHDENGFNELWTDYLKPLLQDYIRGLYDEKEIMNKFEKAYGYKNNLGEIINEND